MCCCSLQFFDTQTCEDSQTAGFRVPIMMLQPLVPRDTPDGAAAEEVKVQMHQGKHKAHNNKRGQIEDGEIEEGSQRGAAGVSKRRKRQSSSKGFTKTIAVGSLVLLRAHLDATAPEGTSGHVHEVVRHSFRESGFINAQEKVLELTPLPSGPECIVSESEVAPIQENFARAWDATCTAGDGARKLSLFHGWLKFAREQKPNEPYFAALRSLRSGLTRQEAQAHAEEMKDALGV